MWKKQSSVSPEKISDVVLVPGTDTKLRERKREISEEASKKLFSLCFWKAPLKMKAFVIFCMIEKCR